MNKKVFHMMPNLIGHIVYMLVILALKVTLKINKPFRLSAGASSRSEKID